MTHTASRGSSQQRGSSAARVARALPVASLIWGGALLGCGGEGAADARDTAGLRDGAGGTSEGEGASEKSAPQPCTSDAECVDGCSIWFEDLDADGFGRADGGAGRGFCGSQPPALGFPVAANADDCCDSNGLVNPAQTDSFPERIEESCALARGYDYDCDGTLRYRDELGATPWVGACDDTSSPGNDPNIPCAERSGVFVTEEDAADPFTFDGGASACGSPSTQWRSCSLVGDACAGQVSSAPPCN